MDTPQSASAGPAVLPATSISARTMLTAPAEQDCHAAGSIAVIVNPATHGDAQSIVELLRSNAPAHVDLDVRFTTAPGMATDLARAALAADPQAIVAVGGDGTVAQVAAALRDTDVPLGVVPGGSTNITAREAGIPTDPRRAVSLLFGTHRHTPFDIGLWGDLPFLHMAGTGLDSRIFASAKPAVKRRVGWLAYLPPAVRDLRSASTRFTIVVDDERAEVTALAILVANGASIITPRLSLYEGIRTDDGWLDVLVFTPVTPIEILRTLGAAVTQQLSRSRYVTHLRARHVEIAAETPLPVELDGDIVTETPVTMTIKPSALRLIVPVQR
jgi:diacylglycerol kinase (ATP)